MTPWAFTGTARENREHWCAGEDLEMAMTFFYGGREPPTEVDLTGHAGETLVVFHQLATEAAWFADVVEGGATVWALE